jgi:hypothetical protein
MGATKVRTDHWQCEVCRETIEPFDGFIDIWDRRSVEMLGYNSDAGAATRGPR